MVARQGRGDGRMTTHAIALTESETRLALSRSIAERPRDTPDFYVTERIALCLCLIRTAASFERGLISRDPCKLSKSEDDSPRPVSDLLLFSDQPRVSQSTSSVRLDPFQSVSLFDMSIDPKH